MIDYTYSIMKIAFIWNIDSGAVDELVKRAGITPCDSALVDWMEEQALAGKSIDDVRAILRIDI